MVLQPRLSVSQTQSLALTPAFRASIELLQLSVQDLEAYLATKLEENPLLERSENPPTYDRLAPSRSSVDILAERVAATLSLEAHLQQQMGLLFPGGTQARVAARFVEALDEAGYLEIGPERVAAELGVSADICHRVLRRLQGLEPSGVFARNLCECLALQLAAQGRLDSFMQGLLDGLAIVAEEGTAALAGHLAVPEAAVVRGLAEIRCLDPKPGLSFETAAVIPLVPDLLVTRDGRGRLEIAINPETVPRVGLDRYAHAILLPKLRSREDRDFFLERRQEVSWLQRALSRRFESLLAVGRAILAQQADYFTHGPSALKPLTRRRLAERLNLSEATVSRVVANKYLTSPRGTEPLKRFFSAGLGATGAVSAAAAQERLRELVAGEPLAQPMSDAALAARLTDNGLPVARRTVAKYRDLLRIPPAADRRRLNQHR